MLPLLGDTRTAKLHVEIDEDVQLETLELPLVMVERTIKAFAAICKPAILEAFVLPCACSSEAFPSIVVAVLRALTYGGFSSIVLGTFGNPYEVLVGSQILHTTFRTLARHLQSLELDVCWAGLLTLDLALPHLRKLNVYQGSYIYNSDVARTLLATVSSLLNACGSTLRSFGLNVNVRPGVVAGGLQELDGIQPKNLESLELAGDAFSCLHTSMRALAFETLDVAVAADATWQELHNVLTATPVPPKRISVEVRRYVQDASAWQRRFDMLRQTTQTIGIVLAIKTHIPVRIASALDLHEGLRDLAPHLLTVRLDLPNAAFDPIAVYAANSGICFVQCSSITITLMEDLNAKYLGSPSFMFSALMRYIEAPRLQTIFLHFTSPLSEYLPSLVDAISRNAFPALDTIKGRLTVRDRFFIEEDDDALPSHWQSGVGAVRKAALERICSERGICLEEVKWH